MSDKVVSLFGEKREEAPVTADMEKQLLEQMSKVKPNSGPVHLGTITVQVNTCRVGKTQADIERELANRQRL